MILSDFFEGDEMYRLHKRKNRGAAVCIGSLGSYLIWVVHLHLVVVVVDTSLLRVAVEVSDNPRS